MRFICLALLLFFGYQESHAQFQVGSAQIAVRKNPGLLDAGDLRRFKSTTTIFVVQNRDSARLDEFRKSIAAVWTVTPFRVVLPDSSAHFTGPEFSRFIIGGYQGVRKEYSSAATGIYTVDEHLSAHLSYDLVGPAFTSIGRHDGDILLARFRLYANRRSEHPLRHTVFSNTKRMLAYKQRVFDELQRSGVFYNWGPGQIRGFLKSINGLLLAGETRAVFDSTVLVPQIFALERDTLYIPDYVRSRRNWFGSTSVERAQDAKTSRKYSLPYRYVSESELERLISESSRPVYHAVYVQNNLNMHLSIVEGRSGTIVYTHIADQQSPFRNGGFARLAAFIRYLKQEGAPGAGGAKPRRERSGESSQRVGN